MVVAGSKEVARTRERALTDTSPVLVVSTTANAVWYVSGTAASATTSCISTTNSRAYNRFIYL